jgi:serine protease Do
MGVHALPVKGGLGAWCALRAAAALASAGLLCAAPPLAAQPASFAPLVRAQHGKVVHIQTRTGSEPADDAETPSHLSGLQATGTGIIVSADGLIVTNFHLVSGAPEVAVTLESGRTYKAVIVGTDTQTDLALLRIPATGLRAVEFGDSDRVEVGDWVIAIGSPLGFNFSVSAGIISAKGRNIHGMDNLAFGEFLQTDAAINPGSSGGPLFSLDGKVVGIASAVSRRGQGIAFAVPSNLVAEVVRQLREHGRVIRGWLGVVIQELPPELAESLGLPEGAQGVLVEGVHPGGPAAAAGLRKNDVITRLRGELVTRVAHLQKLVALAKPGTTLAAEGLRRAPGEREWKVFVLSVTVALDPSQNPPQAGTMVLESPGLELAPIPESHRQRLGLAVGVGALVERVLPGGGAHDAGLQAGDVILEVNRQEVRGPDDAAAMLERQREQRLALLIRRGGQVLHLVLTPAR